MAITKNYNRQSVSAAEVVINLADLDGTAQAAVELPAGAIVVGGAAYVSTAFDAQTTATLKVGDAVDDDRYTGTALDLKTVGGKALVPTGYVMPAQGDVLVTYASTGTAATEGTLRLVVQYIDIQKSEFTQG